MDRSRNALDEYEQTQALGECCATLSRREQQVMSLVVGGLLNKQIGGKLDISEITAKAHRGKVMQKMKANSVAELVRMCARLRPYTRVPVD